MTEPLLTIVIPFFGDPDQFRIAVESVLAQDEDRWLLVVIDDANPDKEPGRWLTSVSDPRIRYLRHSMNQGITSTFNESAALATTPFVTILGCDDILESDYVSHVTALIRAYPESDFVQPGVRVIDDTGRPIRTLADSVKAFLRPRGKGPRFFDKEELAASLMRGNWLYFPSIAWRTAAVREFGFRPEFSVVQDLALVVDLILADRRLLLDDVTVFRYRRHAASLSSSHGPDGFRFREEQVFFTEAAKRFAQRGWRLAERRARRHLVSRLHALAELPASLKTRNHDGAVALWRHISAR